MTTVATTTSMSQLLAPSTAASSPRLDDIIPDMLKFESSCNRLDDRYTLPPIHLDVSLISFELPVHIQHEHRLYEAKAPPPLALPRSVAFTPIPEDDDDEEECNMYINEYESTPESETASANVSPSPSLIPLPPSRSPFPENPLAPIPSPPPSLPVSPARPVAQRQSLPVTRRYLAPAYVRGECLPFAIAEEPEPETSGSEYSEEFAVALNTVQPSFETGSDSTTNPTESTSASRGSATEDDVPQALSDFGYLDLDAAWHQDTVEKRSKRSALKPMAFGNRIKGLMLIGQKVGFRGRLRL